MRNSVLAGLTAVAAVGFALPAQAAVVTQCGPNICYQYDNAQPAASLFGLPTLLGDIMFFTPTTFEARSADGVGIHTGTNTDVVDATWVFTRVYTTNNTEITSILAYEEGDYETNYANGEVHGDLYLRARGLTVPVLVLTAYEQPHLIAAVRSAGADDLVQKPCDNELLLERMQRLMAA